MNIIGALYILVTKGYRRGWKTQKTRLTRNTRRHTWRHTLVRGQMGPPLNRDVQPAVGTWRRLPMGLLSFLFVSPYSLFLCIVSVYRSVVPPLHRWPHKARQNKTSVKGVPFSSHTRAAAQVARATSTLENGTTMGCRAPLKFRLARRPAAPSRAARNTVNRGTAERKRLLRWRTFDRFVRDAPSSVYVPKGQKCNILFWKNDTARGAD